MLFAPGQKGYAMVRNLIDHPEPHEPEELWSLINSKQGRGIADNYPPKFVRKMLIAGRMRQDHKSGIAEQYDDSNDFYKLFLDLKFMFYSCADFHSADETMDLLQLLLQLSTQPDVQCSQWFIKQ